MTATIEKAKAENPKELQKKIRELEKLLKQLERKKRVATIVDTKTVEKRVVIEKSLTRLEQLVQRAEKLEEQLRDTSTAINRRDSDDCRHVARRAEDE